MPKKKGKAVSFDAMVKFFMQNYEIPTKNDVDRLMARLDRIENLIKASNSRTYASKRTGGRKPGMTALDTVYDAIKRSKQGLGVTDIQAKTGFNEKKIRNVIFRLNKIGKIKRKHRGIYLAG